MIEFAKEIDNFGNISGHGRCCNERENANVWSFSITLVCPLVIFRSADLKTFLHNMSHQSFALP